MSTPFADTSSPAAQALLEKGFIVGARDERRRPGFAGLFMVAETLDEGEDPARNSAYCVVGNDLDELIEEAVRHWDIEVPEE